MGRRLASARSSGPVLVSPSRSSLSGSKWRTQTEAAAAHWYGTTGGSGPVGRRIDRYGGRVAPGRIPLVLALEIGQAPGRDIRELIRHLAAENAGWGAPSRIATLNPPASVSCSRMAMRADVSTTMCRDSSNRVSHRRSECPVQVNLHTVGRFRLDFRQDRARPHATASVAVLA
jgi:hypothetical protein